MDESGHYSGGSEYLYDDPVGRDACGIGAVASPMAEPSHEVVEKALTALVNVEHRGGVCGEVGDGAGLLCQIPQTLFREEAKRLGLDRGREIAPHDRLAVGMFMIHERDEARRQRVRDAVESLLAPGPWTILGWRVVPTDSSVVPEAARATQPDFEQIVLLVDGDPARIESALHRARQLMHDRLAADRLRTDVVTLSNQLVGYKGLLTSPQLAQFFPDLRNPGFATRIALFHRRYSTNTRPNWTLAQPFRCLGHNGEINTIRTTRQAARAYSRARGIAAPHSVLSPGVSDSANLDEWISHLTLERGWSLLRALRLSIPPVCDSEAESGGQDAADLFAYSRRVSGGLAAWDGPAGVVASDGRFAVGLVDRLGLRPVRWCTDDRGWLYIGSESGIYGLDPARIAASGQLEPGQMVALDTETGERLESRQIIERVIDESRADFGDPGELNREQLVIPEEFDYNPQLDAVIGDELEQRGWDLEQLLQAHGWDFERMEAVRHMAQMRKEPISSMGFDRVLTVFSVQYPTLFKYFQQTFAEVTNPPIDPYREGSAMSMATYLGRSPESAAFATGPLRQLELSSPVMSDAVFEEARRNEALGLTLLSAVYPWHDGPSALHDALQRLREEAETAVRSGYSLLCVSHKEAFHNGLAPIPSLLALSAVHEHLCETGLRAACSLIVQAGDVQEGHDLACLVGFGADAVHPYMMIRLIRDGLTVREPDGKQSWTLGPRECLENLFTAIEESMLKIMSKMGITTIEGYRGARLFEAIGVGPELMEFLGDCPSRLGGIGFAQLVEDTAWRIDKADKTDVLARNRDYHAFNGKVRNALRDAATAGADTGESAYEARLLENRLERDDALSPEYRAFSELVNRRAPTVLRDLFDFRDAEQPIAVNTVQPAIEIVRQHFRGAAMSHGALTRESHETLAAAFNDLGGFSNSGEGGEARDRNDIPTKAWSPFWQKVREVRRENPHLTIDGDPRRSRVRSRIRQVASGRFGVDAEYLVNADEIQIKMAQGAKPGEGGQLMGKKVTPEIAEIRFARPGSDLISPPPHHDIYSIEDLAQLIFDLKAVRPQARISVKLVAVENVGTIAVGVAKAGADVIEIDGIDGGTGAAAAASKEHCGLPSEMGLAEAHQALALNGLRSTVKLRVGGGIKNGHDVVKYCLLGADEFSFGQGLMVSVGCIVCKKCYIPNCPTGITGRQGPYRGEPEHTRTYLLSVAEEARRIAARLGARSLSELVGRSDLLARRNDLPPRAALINVSKFFHPELALDRIDRTCPQSPAPPTGPCDVAGRRLNERLIEAARPIIESPTETELTYAICNSDRAVGAPLAGLIAELYGRDGLPENRRIVVRFEGDAGQSFGAWCVAGLDLRLRGVAQDGVAKGISGGSVTVVSGDQSDVPPSLVGNNVAYGATGGRVYIGGRAGHRLGIRNSGATIVAEGAGKFAAEYMTRGRLVILGEVENEIGAGMTGGEVFVIDRTNSIPAKLHSGSVAIVNASYVDYEWLHPLVIEHYARSGSGRAARIVRMWNDIRRRRWLRKIVPIAVATKAEAFITAGSNAG